jgi:hypothetical protein
MTTEQKPTIKLELTDKQLEVLGTAIGKEVVRVLVLSKSTGMALVVGLLK